MSSTDKYCEEKCNSTRAIKSDEDTIINRLGDLVFAITTEWKKRIQLFEDQRGKHLREEEIDCSSAGSHWCIRGTNTVAFPFLSICFTL